MDSRQLIRSLSRPQRVRILDTIKRRGALSVGELSESLKLSYMGVKQHCAALEREGLLSRWRRPRDGEVGRPEQAYRLTRKAEEFFPEASNPMTLGVLRAAADLFGPLAPQKILFRLFEAKKEEYRAKIRGGTLIERIRWVARLRDADGHMTEVVETEGCPGVFERHSPIADVAREFPCVGQFEADLYSDLCGCVCRRVMREDLPGTVCEFRFPAVGEAGDGAGPGAT